MWQCIWYVHDIPGVIHVTVLSECKLIITTISSEFVKHVHIISSLYNVFFVLIVNTKKNAIVDKSLSNQMHVHGVLKHIDERKAKHDVIYTYDIN